MSPCGADGHACNLSGRVDYDVCELFLLSVQSPVDAYEYHSHSYHYTSTGQLTSSHAIEFIFHMPLFISIAR